MELLYILPIVEKLLIIAAVVTIILISSSSTGYLLPCSLLLLGDYDALLNKLFFVFVVGHP